MKIKSTIELSYFNDSPQEQQMANNTVNELRTKGFIMEGHHEDTAYGSPQMTLCFVKQEEK